MVQSNGEKFQKYVLFNPGIVSSSEVLQKQDQSVHTLIKCVKHLNVYTIIYVSLRGYHKSKRERVRVIFDFNLAIAILFLRSLFYIQLKLKSIGRDNE